MSKLPERTSDTMGEAIALSSPNGRMSGRARAAANERLRVALFGEDGLQVAGPAQPSRADALRRQAAELRDLAGRGMKPRAYAREAARLEAEAKALDGDAGSVSTLGVLGLAGVAVGIVWAARWCANRFHD